MKIELLNIITIDITSQLQPHSNVIICVKCHNNIIKNKASLVISYIFL